MKRIIALVATLCFLSGCCSAQTYKITEFDGKSTEQTLVIKSNDHYLINMTDGIFACSEDFSVAEQITNEFCIDPYVYNNKLYYIGEYMSITDTLKSRDLSTEEVEILYQFDKYNGYRHVGDFWYVCDGNRVIKIREEDGMHLYETTIKDLCFVEFINDEFMLYRLEYDNQTIMLFDLKTKSINKVFSLEEGVLGETIMCDGANVYYSLIHNDESVSFCRYNMDTNKHTTLLEEGFGEEFNIYDHVCYYYTYTRGDIDGYLKAFDMKTNETKTLLTTKYSVEDINVLDNKLFYRVTDYGKQIEVLNLEDGTTIYLYEKYAEITKRVP